MVRTLEDLLLVTQPNNESDTMEVCEAADVKEECDNGALRDFFETVTWVYAPSTLWVVYACVYRYIQEKHSVNLRTMSRLQRYLKSQSSSYICSKSKTSLQKIWARWFINIMWLYGFVL